MGRAAVFKSEAEDLCRKFPNATTCSLARKLRKGRELQMTVNASQLAIRKVRGTQGKHQRTYTRTKVERKSKPSSNPLQCPPSAAEPWLPVQIDGPCRVLVMSDMHVPFHSQPAIEAAVKYGRRFKPDVVLLLGDIADFYNMSRWEKDPRQRDLKFELDTIKELLKWLRRQFPKARIIYKLGNHEDRYDRFIWNRAPEIWNLDNIQLHNVLDFDAIGIERVDDQPIMCGKLPALHGHETGRTISSPVNPARGLFLRTKHTALIGHLHQTSGHGESNLWHDETFCWSIGCLSDLCPKWLRINRWNHGLATIEVASDNQFDLNNLRMSADFNIRTA